MNYSTTHKRFGELSSNAEALTNPQDFLGPNYETVLNFWWTIDSLTETQWKEVVRRYRALDPAAWSATWSAAGYAAGSAAGYAAGYAAGSAAGYATYELMGMHTLFNDGKTLLFVPLFDFTGNYELQSLDVKEIETRIQRINDFIGPKVEVENYVTMTEEDLECFIEDIELFD
jgi:hypothetical protein